MPKTLQRMAVNLCASRPDPAEVCNASGDRTGGTSGAGRSADERGFDPTLHRTTSTKSPQTMSASSKRAMAGRSPESGRVHFGFIHPTAQRVCVAGSFNGWNPSATPLAPAGHRRWLRELWLPPGQYEYLFVVDGEWAFDPNATDYAPNIFGGMNAIMEVQPPAARAARPRRRHSPFLAARRATDEESSAKRVECLA